MASDSLLHRLPAAGASGERHATPLRLSLRRGETALPHVSSLAETARSIWFPCFIQNPLLLLAGAVDTLRPFVFPKTLRGRIWGKTDTDHVSTTTRCRVKARASLRMEHFLYTECFILAQPAAQTTGLSNPQTTLPSAQAGALSFFSLPLLHRQPLHARGQAPLPYSLTFLTFVWHTLAVPSILSLNKQCLV